MSKKTQSSPPTPGIFSIEDLVVDRIYQGGRAGNSGDDPLPKLLGVSNQGGFRYIGKLNELRLVVLVTSLADADWPDHLDATTGQFVYFGDNKHPGRQLHNTPRSGNLILQQLFQYAHAGEEGRRRIPPVLLFANTGQYRDMRFLGLAVPGGPHLSSNEDLAAIWRSTGGERFQNYRSVFTVIDVPAVKRDWLDSVRAGNPSVPSAPPAWTEWVASGRYRPLAAAPTLAWRKKSQQLPQNALEKQLIEAVHGAFHKQPVEFEHCAAKLVRMVDPNFRDMIVTRSSRDGGRDAIGTYSIGSGQSAVVVDFALEAKCYSLGHAVGVKEVARLISRLRHRQFGVLVTTSYLHEQAYKEIIEDRHPVGVLSATDIARLLVARGLGERHILDEWLRRSNR